MPKISLLRIFHRGKLGFLESLSGSSIFYSVEHRREEPLLLRSLFKKFKWELSLVPYDVRREGEALVGSQRGTKMGGWVKEGLLNATM